MKKVKLIALLAAVIAGLAIFQFLTELSKPQEIPHTGVVTAAVNIPENTLITADMLTITPIYTESVLPGSIKSPEAAVGMIMKSDVYAGEQIVTSRLVKVGEEEDNTSLAYNIEPGKRAISVAVNATSSVTNMIKPGNRVDVILTYTVEYIVDNPGEKEDETYTVDSTAYLIQNVPVLAVGQVQSKTGIPEYSTVTLQVSPEDALYLNYSETYFSIRLVLRSPLDDEIISTSAITLGEILLRTGDVE